MPISTKLTHKREKVDRLTDESFKALHHVSSELLTVYRRTTSILWKF
jgi:hypothetical protein